jgi:hypothetical protein
MMAPEDVEALAASIEAKRIELIKQHKAACRVHWPRRLLILGGGLAAGIALHYLIDDTGLKSCLQSAELALGAIFDSVFARIRDIEA